MESTLITLAEFHYELGYIGYDEYCERVRVALWLSGSSNDNDPRLESGEDPIPIQEVEEYKNSDVVDVISKTTSGIPIKKENKENWMEFLCLGKWVFTKSDPDSYPSVPHGHYQHQNVKWPKLNPYTGRVFKSKHQEDQSQRLSKTNMREIWSDEKFKSYCREMIVWYQEQFPHYNFPVRRPLKFPIW